MRNLFFVLLVTTVLAVVAFSAAQSAPIKLPPGRSKITITSVHATEKSGSKITIMVKETVLSDGPDGLIVGRPTQYDVDVRGIAGKLAPKTELGERLNGISNGSRESFYAKTGEVSSGEIVVSDLYDMSQPGKYLIQVFRRSDKSNTITVTVVP
ncbi:MAG: hypothetical protein WAL71_16080 [Terriglobales bacterium]|jgi:hypothetical protein